MGEPNISVNYSGRRFGSVEVVRGQLLVPADNDTSYYLPATDENCAGRRAEAIALDTIGEGQSGSIAVRQTGTISAELSGLEPYEGGSWCRRSSEGRIERCTPAEGDDIVGYADEDGRVHLTFGYLTAEVLYGSATANDIVRSDGTTIDTVAGFNGTALETTDTPSVGDCWVYDGIDEKYRAAHPTPPDWVNVRRYGATGDGTTDDVGAFRAALAAVAVGGTVFVPRGTYRFASTLVLNKAITFTGSGPARYGDYAYTARILVDDGVTGISAVHGNMAEADGATATGTVIQNLNVKAAGHTVPGAYGLHMQTNVLVQLCTFDGFSSHGIFIDSSDGFPDNWQLQWTRSANNGGNGVHVEGPDSNNGLAIGLDVQNNRGWGVYEASFLGCTYISTHTAENLLGGVYCKPVNPGVSSFIGTYGESDQPPSEFNANNVSIIGGLIENGYTTGSKFFGGLAHASRSTAWAVTSPASLVGSGTNPPRVSLIGQNTSTTYAQIRIEITTAGYPDGKDEWGASAGATAAYRWSIDNGGSWNGPIAMPSAWEPYNAGLCQQSLGNGLTAVFTPGYYSLDNVWTAEADGVPATFFRAGSDDGTGAACSWGHYVPGAAGADPVGGFDLKWQPTQRKWQYRWGSSLYFQHAEFSGTTLPLPGKLTFNDAVYFGTEAVGYQRIGAASAAYTVGSSDWHTSAGLTIGAVSWYPAGALVLNKSDTVHRPGGWRATRNGGWGYKVGGGATFVPAFTYRPGESIEANGYVYRALTLGTAGADDTASWSTTPGATIANGTITWECYGAVGGLEPVDIQSEVLGTYNATAGSATLTLDQCSYERLKITGSPVATFALVMPGCAGASGWLRVIWNTSGQACTVKGSSGDMGTSVPNGTAYQILSDGTNCVRVE